MELRYKNRGLEKICNCLSEAEKKHGTVMAELIHMRIDQLTSAESVEQMIMDKIGKTHKLKGKRKNTYAMNLIQPFRLVFEIKENGVYVANILEIVDYH